MIAGVKSALENRVAQVYVTDFGDVRIYPFTNVKDAQNFLSCYFMDYDVTEHLHSDNVWDMNRSKKWRISLTWREV